jgi:aspartate 1-decarboxylase
MAFQLTENATQLLTKNNITPQIVLQIDGVSTLYGAVPIQKILKVGDPELLGDPGLTVGGLIDIAEQKSLVSFSGGTSSSISQTLNIDKGTNESISSLTIALLDKGLLATRLITPGQIVPELLGKRAKIWYGEADGAWKEDYFIVFRGIIDDIDAAAGLVRLNLASPDTLKKTTTFVPKDTELTASMTNSDTTATVLSTLDFLKPYTNPSGGIDISLKLYIKINDEIIRYESTTGTTFDTLTRGQLGTVAATHDIGDTVDSFYRIEGNSIDLALQFMMSGQSDPYIEAKEVRSFVNVPSVGAVTNAIYFDAIDLILESNVQIGDYVTITGATNGANNVTDEPITDIVNNVSGGTYIVLGGVSLVTEDPTSAVIDFVSKYDVWGPGAGLGMKPEEVDIVEHLSIKNTFLQDTPMDIYLKEEIEDGRVFLSEQLYNPVSAYAIPRKAQASIGYHIGPIPGTQMITLSDKTVLNASKLSIKRTVNKNFYNTIIYKFDQDPLEDKFLKGTIAIDSDSVDRIKVGNKALKIEANGLRSVNSAVNIAQLAASRRLEKYKFAAESIKGVKLKLGDAMFVEVGDKVIVDMASLKLTDLQTATRAGNNRIFEIVNKTLNIKGDVEIDIVDTNFDLNSRFALIGPSSFITSSISTTQFIIGPSFTAPFGNNEYLKWQPSEGSTVVIHSEDWTVSGTAILTSADSNTITLATSPGFTPLPGYLMELDLYDGITSNDKLIYGFMSDGALNFSDGGIAYQMS